MTVQIYAHRGSSAAFAEHSRAAYLQALDDGADGVECDVHLSADGELILLHDERVERTSNGSGPVSEMTLEQLRELDFFSWHGASLPYEFGTIATQLLTLPELLELLAAAGRPVGLAIEFKYEALFEPSLIDAALTVLRGAGWTAAAARVRNVEVTFMSFHPEAVEYLAKYVPAEQLCQLLECTGREHDPALIAGEKLLDRGVAHLAGPGMSYLRAKPENALKWVAAGRVLRAWTVDTAEDLQLCVTNGVTEVTSNTPLQLRSLLATLPPV